jgi:adenosine deaminase
MHSNKIFKSFQNFFLWIFVFLMNLLLAKENVPEFHQLPKAELHLHLGGSFPKDYLLSIASAAQQEELIHALDLVAQGINYHAGFQVFGVIARIVNSEEKLQSGVSSLCKCLERDNVRYVEIRTGLKDLGQGTEGYLKAVLRGIHENASTQLKANVVLSLQRSSSKAMVHETIDLGLKYRDQGVIGIDISGNAAIGQIDQIIPDLLRAKKSGLAFTVHIGEVPEETDQMLLLTLLEPKRVGHGVHLCQEAKEWILKHRIPLEVCLTSSVLVKMIADYKQHPGLEFFRLGHPIVFCTDDPLLFSTTLSQELSYAHRLCGLTAEEIERLVDLSFHYTLENAQD